jgi:hypothetical protein
MSRLRIVFGIVVTGLLSILVACSIDSTTGPIFVQPAAQVTVSRTIRLLPDSSAIEDQVQVQFSGPDSGAVGIYGGEVTINGNPITFSRHLDLDTYGDTVSSGRYESSWLDSSLSPMNFARGGNTVQVTGSKVLATFVLVPAFTRTMPLIRPPMLTSHSAGDTINRSNLLTLTWEPQPGNDAGVDITLIRLGAGSVSDLDSLMLTIRDVPDTGSYTIDAQSLARLVTGPLSVLIKRTAVHQEQLDDRRMLNLTSSALLDVSMYLAE